MKNIPEVKLGVVAVSRNCFPEELSVNRRKSVINKYVEIYGESNIYECPICVNDSELTINRALKSLEKEECNALCIYLGNFGPEISETMLAQRFAGPVMFCAAAEENQQDLIDGRGDAYCGMLNASYSLNLRGVKVYIPESPVADAEGCAKLIHEFLPIARTILGIRNLKIISFGPRPSNFIACNAPIQNLYDLGVEIEENSELDLLESFQKHDNDTRIEGIVADMSKELGCANCMPEILPKMAQYELTLLDWIRNHKGAQKYIALTSKCWPAFAAQFGFVPCYVHSRLTAMGYPVSCEVDIYGALSEYIGLCINQDVVTILDINNTVPNNMYKEYIQGKNFEGGLYKNSDLFMGFHCGNTTICKITKCMMCNQHIMSRSLPLEITKGTLEGDLVPGKTTIYRLQSTSNSTLRAYVAEGEILPVSTKSYGSIGVFAIKEMNRFYRHVLIEKHYPHHAAIAFNHCGKYLYEIFKYLGVSLNEIDYNRPIEHKYISENPF